MPLELDEKQVTCDGTRRRVTFIAYEMDRLFLPPSLGELIPANHVVRIVNEAIERLDDKLFIEHSPCGGQSNYHQRISIKRNYRTKFKTYFKKWIR
ncbi:hypothetical protein RAC89_02285 [Paenibacillus sp. GD4]|uniref:hypothetical protein n=1 Tax=Paenibacillus sp. GD4 TaxID=3068890 RepID=UPI002796C8F4|nr:hypothetical protein [Paenibacillus sp. GD4]MDQ1909327.1 hypothetical protein [Paenibacillus sp. GD4]